MKSFTQFEKGYIINEGSVDFEDPHEILKHTRSMDADMSKDPAFSGDNRIFSDKAKQLCSGAMQSHIALARAQDGCRDKTAYMFEIPTSHYLHDDGVDAILITFGLSQDDTLQLYVTPVHLDTQVLRSKSNRAARIAYFSPVGVDDNYGIFSKLAKYNDATEKKANPDMTADIQAFVQRSLIDKTFEREYKNKGISIDINVNAVLLCPISPYTDNIERYTLKPRGVIKAIQKFVSTPHDKSSYYESLGGATVSNKVSKPTSTGKSKYTCYYFDDWSQFDDYVSDSLTKSINFYDDNECVSFKTFLSVGD